MSAYSDNLDSFAGSILKESHNTYQTP
jgi:hypothetical protein